jgi:pSer/pThr/pTyr-binding forkhead associated (FHA) protein
MSRHSPRRQDWADPLDLRSPEGETVRLIALDGGPDVSLGPNPLIVGRNPSCDLLLDSDQVSRLHCCLTCLRGEVVVRDLGSTNGTRINGLLVESGILRPGDELAIVHFRFLVQ